MLVDVEPDFMEDKKPSDNFNVTVTSNEEETGERESRPQDRSIIQRIDNFLAQYHYWFTGFSAAAIVLVEGYWITRRVLE